MAAFELQTPRERLRYFNVKDYPNMAAVQAAVQGPSPMGMTPSQQFERGMYLQSIGRGNYNYVEKAKFFPLDQVPVDTESSMRKLDQNLLFRSMGSDYNTTPYVQQRVFGGYEPLPMGQFALDPSYINPTRGRSPDIY